MPTNYEKSFRLWKIRENILFDEKYLFHFESDEREGKLCSHFQSVEKLSGESQQRKRKPIKKIDFNEFLTNSQSIDEMTFRDA